MSHLTLIAKGTLPLLAAASICSGADFTANPNKSDAVQVGGVAGIPCGTTGVTQSTDPSTILGGNSVSCNAGGLHTDNSYYRVFDSSKWGEGTFTVCAVEIGIETALGAAGDQPITVVIYDSTDPTSLGAPVHTENVTVANQDMTLLNIPITGPASVSTGLVVEIFTPDGQTDGNSFFIGSNDAGQDSPSYLAAADCGVVAPTPTGDIGFPGMHIVMTVYGDAGCVIGNCLGDTNFDGVVDVSDLIIVINAWGGDGLGVPGVIADTNCDGIVDVTDLVIGVINNWGPCPAKNDECEDRINASDGDNPYSLLGASTNDADPAFECGFEVANDIWYNYTASCSGELTISLCDSDFDTVLQLYSGFDCPPASPIGCNDDSDNCEDLQSELTIAVVAGEEIKIRIGGWNGDAGTGVMNIQCVAAVNDFCEDRIDIGEGDFPFSNIDATTDGPPHAACDKFADPDVQSDVWFNYNATVTGAVSINTCLTGFDTKIAVYGDCDCGNLTDENLLGCNDDTCGLQSEVIIEAVAGNCYKVRVGGFGGAQGEGILQIVEIVPGACCFEDGSCTDGTFAADCEGLGGVFQGFGTLCADIECPVTCGGVDSGGCFEANGTPGCDDAKCCLLICNEIDAFCCDVEWDGICADLALANCIFDELACCFEDGTCQDLTPFDCGQAGGEFQGVDLTCSDAACIDMLGACCFDDASCMELLPSKCAGAGGTHQGAGSACDMVKCIAVCGPGAGSCTEPNGTPGCEDEECCLAVCAVDGFCCDVEWDAICADAAAAICDPTPGACCFPDGSCMDLSNAACADAGGNFQGTGTACASTECPILNNDDCLDRRDLGMGTTPFTNIGATTDGPEPCGIIGSDVWYNINPMADGALVVDTFGTGFDTVLAVYNGCACPADLANLIECNDDSGSLQSQVIFDVLAGNCYKIQLGGFGGAQGTGVVNVTGVNPGACCLGDGTCMADQSPDDCDLLGGDFQGFGSSCKPNPCPAPPANDNCDDRTEIFNGETSFTNFLATTDGPAHADCLFFGDDAVDSDIWYNYDATGGTTVISLCGSGYDTKMAVYDGCECPVGDENLLACNDDACDLQSEVILDLTAGNCYKIRIGGFGGAQGDGVINISTEGPGSGACCYPSGGCLDLTENQCAVSKGTYQGDGTACAAGKLCP